MKIPYVIKSVFALFMTPSEQAALQPRAWLSEL